MRQLGLRDFLRIAAKLLGVEAEIAPLFVRLDRAQRALSQPTAHFAGGGRHRRFSEVAVKLFIDIASAGALPEKNLKCAWLCTRRFLELNGYSWRPQHGDPELFLSLIKEMQAGIDVRARFANWIDNRLELKENPNNEPSDEAVEACTPDSFLYLTSRIVGLTDAEHDELRDWETAIDDEVAAFMREENVAGCIGTFRPIVLPATSSEDLIAILNGIEHRLLEACGFIIFGERGGSHGTGNELALAIASLVPVLFLQPNDEPLSARTESLLNRYGACIRRYPAADRTKSAIVSHVRQWLKRECAALIDSPRQREMAMLRAQRLFGALGDAAKELQAAEFARRLASLGMTEVHGRALLSDIRRFIRASLNEILVLCAALDVPAAIDAYTPAAPKQKVPYEKVDPPAPPVVDRPRYQGRSTRLSDAELDHLEQLASADGYNGAQVARMINVTQKRIDKEPTRASHASVARRKVYGRNEWSELHEELFG